MDFPDTVFDIYQFHWKIFVNLCISKIDIPIHRQRLDKFWLFKSVFAVKIVYNNIKLTYVSIITLYEFYIYRCFDVEMMVTNIDDHDERSLNWYMRISTKKSYNANIFRNSNARNNFTFHLRGKNEEVLYEPKKKQMSTLKIIQW